MKWLFQIHLLEDTSELKISLKYSDGETWCENIVVPELKLLQNSADDSDDHLVIVFDQKAASGGADLTIYFSCIAKGRVHMPLSLREMIEKVKHSKVKIYHGSDIELTVSALHCSIPMLQIPFILPRATWWIRQHAFKGSSGNTIVTVLLANLKCKDQFDTQYFVVGWRPV